VDQLKLLTACGCIWPVIRRVDTDRGDARSSSFRVSLRAEPSYFAAAARQIPPLFPLKILMCWGLAGVIKSGPPLSPRGRGPDLIPVPNYPRGRGRHSYNDLWLFGGRRAACLQFSGKVLPFDCLPVPSQSPKIIRLALTCPLCAAKTTNALVLYLVGRRCPVRRPKRSSQRFRPDCWPVPSRRLRAKLIDALKIERGALFLQTSSPFAPSTGPTSRENMQLE